MSYELKTLFEALAEAGWFALAITTTALFAALLDAPLCEASSPVTPILCFQRYCAVWSLLLQLSTATKCTHKKINNRHLILQKLYTPAARYRCKR